MIWTTPKVIEIAVGMEINCYACADIASYVIVGALDGNKISALHFSRG